MPNEELQQLLHRLSAQTGQPMPSPSEIQSFLSSPGSEMLLQTLLGSRPDTLTEAAGLARRGEFDRAADLVQSYLCTPAGQQLIRRLSQSGANHEQ